MPSLIPYRQFLFDQTEDVTTQYPYMSQPFSPELVESSSKASSLCPEKCDIFERLSIVALVLVIFLTFLVIVVIFYCLKKYMCYSRGIGAQNITDKSEVS